MFASFNDNVIKTFAKKPIEIEKKRSGNQYFLLGILNLQKGKRHKKTTNILKRSNQRKRQQTAPAEGDPTAEVARGGSSQPPSPL